MLGVQCTAGKYPACWGTTLTVLGMQAQEAIKGNALPEFATTCTEELFNVVNKVRGKLTSLERSSLSALIIVDVHARDTVQELATAGVSNVNDFEWTSQLRYSWEDSKVRSSTRQAAAMRTYSRPHALVRLSSRITLLCVATPAVLTGGASPRTGVCASPGDVVLSSVEGIEAAYL